MYFEPGDRWTYFQRSFYAARGDACPEFWNAVQRDYIFGLRRDESGGTL
jgi:hypothetical protein